jgi:hypothetical protein
LICPRCHAEYQDQLTRCEACDEALVADLPAETGAAFAELERSLTDGTATLSAARTLEDAQRDQELLHEASIPCLLYGDPTSLGAQGTPRRYHLALLPAHVAAAVALLGRRRQEMLRAEGLPDSDAVIDLAAAEIQCPACGFRFAQATECPDCGLFLGASS